MAPRSRTVLASAAVVALLLAGAIAWRVVDTDGAAPAKSAQSADAPVPDPATSSAPLASPQPSPELRSASIVDAPAPAAAAVAGDVRALTVEVVDANGAPLEGVVLTLLDARDDVDLAHERTDAHGRARLEAEGPDLAQPRTLHVGAPCVRTTPPYVEFTASSWPADPVRFVAAPTGRVEVTFDSGTYPLGRDAHAFLNIDTDRCGVTAGRGLHDDYFGRALTGPTLVFPHVALNLCFQLGTWTPGLEFPDVSFDGPRHAGEVVRVEVPLEEAQVRIVGRVVDRAGAPLPAHAIVVGGIPSGHRELLDAPSDDDGRFEGFVTPRHASRASAQLSVQARRAGALERAGTTAWPGLDSATRGDGHATVDLGDVVVEPTTLVASGRVRDANGQPPQPWSNVRIELRPLDPRFHDAWIDTPTRVADDGSFQVGLEPAPARFELRALSWGRLPSAPVSAARGADGLELRLRAGTRAEGRILVAEGVDPGLFDLEFECVPPSERGERRVGSYEDHEDGRFETLALEPGRYSVTVSYSGTDLGRREFEVPAVESLDAAAVSIEPFDLREHVHAIAIRVVGRDGSVVGSGTAYDVTVDDDSTQSTIDREGRAVLCATTRAIEVVLVAPGFATQRFADVANGAVLALADGPAVRVHVKGLPPPPAGWVYEAELEPEGEGKLVELSLPALAPLDATGRATLRAPCAGPFTLTASIRRTGTRESHVFAVLDDVRVEPNAGQSAPVLELDPDPADVRGTLERIQPR